eukprot:1327321-Amphidinium_carterae.1
MVGIRDRFLARALADVPEAERPHIMQADAATRSLVVAREDGMAVLNCSQGPQATESASEFLFVQLGFKDTAGKWRDLKVGETGELAVGGSEFDYRVNRLPTGTSGQTAGGHHDGVLFASTDPQA